MLKKLKRVLSSDWFIVLAVFVLAAGIRTVPEIKAGIWPIGYDTFNTYAAELATYQGSLWNFLKTANILYFIFWPFKLLGLRPDLIIKIFGPVLYGFLSISFWVFVRRYLKFSKLQAVLATLLVIFQLGSLRISWDLYRNELGLIFLFFALVNLPKISQTKNLIFFVIFTCLVGLSNELVTVLLIVILIVYWFYLLKRREWYFLTALSIPLVAIIIIFIMVLNFSGQILYDPHIYFTYENNYIWRYFYEYHKVMSYDQLFQTITGLFWLLFQFLLPFALYGFWLLRKNLVLMTMTLWLLIGTFSSLFFAGKGILVWERWLVMLAFPLAIYAIYGIFNLGAILAKPKLWTKRFPKLALVLAIIFWVGYFSLFLFRAIPFVSASYPDAKPPLANEKINIYFPRTMVHNSVGIWKIEYTLDCVQWLNQNAPAGSVVLVDNRFRGLILTRFNLDGRYIITNPWSEKSPEANLKLARKKGLTHIYLIWNTLKSIDGFDRFYSSGNMGVYKALP